MASICPPRPRYRRAARQVISMGETYDFRLHAGGAGVSRSPRFARAHRRAFEYCSGARAGRASRGVDCAGERSVTRFDMDGTLDQRLDALCADGWEILGNASHSISRQRHFHPFVPAIYEVTRKIFYRRSPRQGVAFSKWGSATASSPSWPIRLALSPLASRSILPWSPSQSTRPLATICRPLYHRQLADRLPLSRLRGRRDVPARSPTGRLDISRWVARSTSSTSCSPIHGVEKKPSCST